MHGKFGEAASKTSKRVCPCNLPEDSGDANFYCAFEISIRLLN
jgi:hypothetical protein